MYTSNTIYFAAIQKRPFPSEQALPIFLHRRAAGRVHVLAEAVLAVGLVEAVAAGEVVAVVAVLGEYAAGDVTAQRALAHHVHRLSGVDLAEPPAQFVYGDVDKAVRAAAGVFAGGARTALSTSP